MNAGFFFSGNRAYEDVEVCGWTPAVVHQVVVAVLHHLFYKRMI
jgi:hypothetical protein